MGNILVSVTEVNPYSYPGFLFTFAWIAGIIYAIFKLIVEKPWGAVAFNRRMIARNEAIRQQHFKKIHDQLDSTDQNIVQNRMHIVSLDLFELRDALRSGVFTAVDVLNAFVWKSLMVQTEINCIVDFLDEAFEEAKELDLKWPRNSSGKPPLFGIPFSVKGNFHVRGHDCTIGLAKFLQKPMANDCTLIAYLRSQGAIPFAITTVPQGLMSFTCSSSLYGTTLNPYLHSRTVGGSSGGECALLAAGGSAFGIGSDLAGSLRIPASMCGIVTLKPTEGRLRVKYAQNGTVGKTRVALAYGFFTKTVDQQIFLLNNLLSSPRYCDLVPRHQLFPLVEKKIAIMRDRQLRIGYFFDDGFLKPVPACSRVVLETVEKLKRCGHEMVLFRLPEPEKAASLFYRFVMPFGGDYLLRLYSNEIIPAPLRTFVLLLKVPNFVRYVSSSVLSFISKSLSIIASSYVSDLAGLRRTEELIEQYIENFTQEWMEFELDALICPAFPVPAVPHDYPSRLAACAFSTGFFNMLDFPAGVVPAGTVNADDDKLLADENSWFTGNDPALKLMRRAARDSAGLPVAVQVVTLPFKEEECLAVMKEVEKVWKAGGT